MPQTTGTAVLFSLRIVFLSHPSPWGQRLVPSSRCMNNTAVCLTQGVGGECQDLGLQTKSRAHRYKIPGNSPPPAQPQAPTTQQASQYTHTSQRQTVQGRRPSSSLELTNNGKRGQILWGRSPDWRVRQPRYPSLGVIELWEFDMDQWRNLAHYDGQTLHWRT